MTLDELRAMGRDGNVILKRAATYMEINPFHPSWSGEITVSPGLVAVGIARRLAAHNELVLSDIVKDDEEGRAFLRRMERDQRARAQATHLLELVRLLVMPARVALAAGMSEEAETLTRGIVERAEKTLQEIDGDAQS